MKTKMPLLLVMIGLLSPLASLEMLAQGTAFSYQGRLADGAGPANGSYDLHFRLYDAPMDGNPIGAPLTNAVTAISNGQFTVTLDFGPGVFAGNPRWLEIGVRHQEAGGDFVTLQPRQPLHPTPYALFAATAGTAVSVPAANLTGNLQSNQLAPGAVTAQALAPGAAAANLQASGLKWVSEIIASSNPNDTNLLQAGYLPLGSFLTESTGSRGSWQNLSRDWLPDRRNYHSAVWTGSEMLIWGGQDAANRSLRTGWRYSALNGSWQPISTSNAPLARYYHTAIWVNGRMIVWGGNTASGYTQTGGSYDPAADRWTPLSTNNAPSPRDGFTAVAAEGEFIVWGGRRGTNYLADGARYNLLTEAWSTLSPLQAPSPRLGHSAVWTGSEMIIWGGGQGTNYLADGARYQPSTDTWVPLPATGAPAPRQLHAAVWTGAEMVVWGGYGTNNWINSGGRYHATNDLWLPTNPTNAPASRSSPTVVWTGTEMIIWGGGTGMDTGAKYSPSNDTWLATAINSAPTGRYGHTAIWSGTEMIVWGGIRSNLKLLTGGKYNSTLNSWQATEYQTGNPVSCYGHAAVWTGNEMIIYGGSLRAGEGARYRPETGTWTAMKPAPEDHQLGCTAIWTGSEMIVWGGTSSAVGSIYNPTTDTWRRTSRPSKFDMGRMDHSAVWTGTEMIIWGGRGGMTPLNHGLRYNPSNDSWAAISDLLGQGPGTLPRFGHTAIWTGTEMLVWGGYINFQERASTTNGFRYPGFSPLANGPGEPSARAFHTAIWTGTEMIIWGGQGYDPKTGKVVCDAAGARFNPLGDTWSVIGTNGAPLSELIESIGGGRSRHTAVWTGQEMIVWGGVNEDRLRIESGGRPMNSGGLYKPGLGWTRTETQGAPAPASQHTAIWTGDAMLVFGGSNQESPYPFYSYKLTKTVQLYIKR